MIRVNLYPLEAKTALPYLGSTVTYNNSNCSTLYSNLRKSQRRWVIVAKVIVKTGVPTKAREMIYKSVVQVVLLYGCYI